jgi:superkiller protein 3
MGLLSLKFLPLLLTLSLASVPNVAFAQTLEQLLQQGNAALDAKKYSEAENIWRKVIQLNPNNAVAFSNLCDALYRQNKLDESIGFCRKAIELGPKYVNAYYNLGNALYSQKKLDEAIAQFRKAIELNPKFALAYSNLGAVLYEQKKLDEAIAQFRKAIELDPKYVDAYNNLGVALRAQKKLDEAIAQFRKAIELDPKYVDAYNNLGVALSDQKKLDEAIAQFRKAIELDPKYVNAYNNLGVALRAQKKLDEAIVLLRKALSFPDASGTPITAHTLAHSNLGSLLQEQGKLAEAIVEFEKAAKIDPGYEYAQNNLIEARRLLALQQSPEQIVALNEIKYLPKDEPLTPIKRSIVKVSVVFQGNAKGTGYGTGYAIKRQGDRVWIITNRHVVVDRDTEQSGSNLEVEPYYGNPPKELPRSRSTAKVVNMTMPNEPLDLALLEVTGLPADIQP